MNTKSDFQSFSPTGLVNFKFWKQDLRQFFSFFDRPIVS